MTRRGWYPSVIGALIAAAVLLAVGVLMAVYEEQLYSAQQVKNVREQAQILAASVTAAIVFDDRSAAQEYVDALAANPELKAGGVYDKDHLLAGFSRGGTHPPQSAGKEATYIGPAYIEITVPASQNGVRVGTVMLRAVTEPVERRYARYGGLILLVTMGALVIAVLSFSQAALSRRAQQLASVNTRLQHEMETRRKTEEALRQSHKMEAIGQLSGGIAHDFNNLIMIARGNLLLLKRKLNSRQAAEKYIAAADEALDRAANLTQRILAFSRRQPLTPQRVQISAMIQGLSDLIRHSVGERVATTMRLECQWSTLCDINQMENVILNLAINARDAMPDGGRLTIATSDVTLNGPTLDLEEEFALGDYVALSVIDTGIGMSEEVRRRAVDPFFTTKPLGKGTGLGLSMTYGFVRQTGGHLIIESTPALGTTITILLPREKETA